MIAAPAAAGDRPDEHPSMTPTAQPASLAAAVRCGARTRSGAPCRSPAVGGRGRCRMHGGKGSGAPRGNRNAVTHGLRTAHVRAISRYLRATRFGRLATPWHDGGTWQPAEKNHEIDIQPHAKGESREKEACHAPYPSFPRRRESTGKIGRAHV
jgi:hypothetical protein